MTRDEVRTLASMPGMEIGSHSVTHPRLSALSSAAQREEIESSTREVERVTARRVASFAYPFGKPRDYSSETTRIVGDAGLLRACTNVRGLAVADTDPYELPRLFVYDCDGADFGSLLASQLALVQAP
jgi:peptidoglycan/xylan/chitin deacetylase (PgdA/CDA1 family)